MVQDSDYGSDPDPTGHKLDPFTAHKADTEIVDNSPSVLPSGQEHYAGAGEAIGHVDSFDQENGNLCRDRWAPFSSVQGFPLEPWFIKRKVPKSRMNEYFSSGLSSSVLVGYSSRHTLENHLVLLDRHSSYLQWFEVQVEDSKRTLPFLYRNVQDCMRYLLGQIAYQDELVYTPPCQFDSNGEWIYAEIHTGDRWWDVQVQCPNLCYCNVS